MPEKWTKKASNVATRLLAAGALIAAHPAGTADDVVTVFGLPLGGTIGELEQCKGSGPPPEPCWIEKPPGSLATIAGRIRMPDERLPSWAVYTTFRITVRNGTLDSILLTSKRSVGYETVVASISQRFGPPSQTVDDQDDGLMAADWSLPGIGISTFCSPSIGCLHAFMSAREWARHQAESAKRQAAEKARPKTP